jgi:hypothetical protein
MMFCRDTALRLVSLIAVLMLASACALAAAGPKPALGGSQALADGTFVRESGQPTIYVIQRGKRRAFPTFETYVGWGGKEDLSNVQVLNAADMASIPRGDTVPVGSRPSS